MTTAPVRIGLIGLGAIGQRIIRSIGQNPDLSIQAVCDTDSALAARTAETLGNIPWSTDYRAMLEGDVVDVVYVGVPPRFHHRIALDVVAAGKHIFCEKPLALNVAEAEEMAAAVKQAGAVNALNLSMHYSPGVAAFASHRTSGYLGELQRVDLNILFPKWPRAWQENPWIASRAQGGPVREVGPHWFHFILREFGPVVRVRADMAYPADPERCETGAAGILELAGGQWVNVNILTGVPRPEVVALTAYGTEGTLGLTEWSNPVGSRTGGALEPLPKPEDVKPLTANLVQAVRGQQADLVGFDMGVAIQKLLEAWERASETGTWVNV